MKLCFQLIPLVLRIFRQYLDRQVYFFYLIVLLRFYIFCMISNHLLCFFFLRFCLFFIIILIRKLLILFINFVFCWFISSHCKIHQLSLLEFVYECASFFDCWKRRRCSKEVIITIKGQ